MYVVGQAVEREGQGLADPLPIIQSRYTTKICVTAYGAVIPRRA
jgi:hypothetical protein